MGRSPKEKGRAQPRRTHLGQNTDELELQQGLVNRFVLFYRMKNGKIKAGVNTMTKEFSVIIERDEEGYYVASVPELPGCHTQAKSLDKLMTRIREAIELCLEVEKDLPVNQFIGVQRVSVEI
jgi:predicted RNase H-like HicB family nuclease